MSRSRTSPTSSVDTSGWYLVVNRGTGAGTTVNSFYYSKTCFPATLAPGEVAYWTDSTTEHYVGFPDIPFGTSGRGWAMIMDSQGNVVDFVAWVYPADQIAAMNITVDGHNVLGSSLWSGAGVMATINPVVDTSVYRIGNADHDNAADFVFQPRAERRPAGVEPRLAEPGHEFLFRNSGQLAEIGHRLQHRRAGPRQRDPHRCQEEMLGVNASLWTRIPFDVADPADVGSLWLAMHYNDGFVAYLNGQEIARRNAPASLAWDSNATAHAASTIR